MKHTTLRNTLIIVAVFVIVLSLLALYSKSENALSVFSDESSDNIIAESSIVNDALNTPSSVPAGSGTDYYHFPPTKYNRLSGQNLPAGLKSLDKLTVRITPGEYEPLSFLISSGEDLNNVTISNTDLIGSNGNIPASMMDGYIAKVWYQAGIKFNENKDRVLTQELLIKNDKIIKVDENNKTNLLLVKENGKERYIDVLTLNDKNQDNLIVEDSKDLQPFNIDKGTNKQIWFILHVPDNAKAGKYSGSINIKADNKESKSIPVEVEVLPFILDPSRLIYGMYYHGYVDNYTKRPMHFTNKTEVQYRIEMQDMKEHGVMYPTTYQIYKNLDADLRIRNEVGLPKDRLFSLGIQTGNPQDKGGLDKLKSQVKQWFDKISKYGYEELFVYGIDEARGDELRSQRKAWQAVREAGAKVFVAGYYETYNDVGDLLNAAVVQKEPLKDQADKYHSKGNLILNYSNPQAGEENPEIYRRNFGLLLWKNNYDGAMEYAYQKNYGSVWNDWDHRKYRDQNFTYPISNGILSTIQWEGYREAIDDVRYLSTLLNLIDEMEREGKNVSELRNWVNSIDPSGDLDRIRGEIIDKIINLRGL